MPPKISKILVFFWAPCNKAIGRNAPHKVRAHGLGAQGLSAHFLRKMCAQSVHSVRALSPCAQSYKNRAVHSVLLPESAMKTPNLNEFF